MNIKNKNITIMGGGISGIGAAQLASYLGANVFLSDNKIIHHDFKHCISYEEKAHTEKCYECDFAIISPGIPTNNTFFNQFKERDIQLISEIEFASWYTDAPIIGITGSNGKSTTVSILDSIFSHEYESTYMGGNIGTPFSLNVLNENKYNAKNAIHILELSSFQLEKIKKFKPYIACILNLSADHLDRYPSIADYYNAKLNITKNLDKKCYLVYNKQNENFYAGLEEKTNIIKFNGGISDSDLFFNNSKIVHSKKNTALIDYEKIQLQGSHNIENILACIQIAKIFNINKTTIKNIIENFKPLNHRMELVKTNDGITYINDSKATNTESAIKAIQSSDKTTILILGGYSKGEIDYREALGMKFDNISHIICYGLEGKNIYDQLKDKYKCKYIADFKDAVKTSIQLAEINHRVLLSPACSSYDQFNNFEERGNKFKQIVKEHTSI